MHGWLEVLSLTSNSVHKNLQKFAIPTIDIGEFQYMLRDGDILSPKIDTTEPVKLLCKHFLDCVKDNKKPITDGKSGADVVKIMCAIDESLKNGGIPVNV